MSHEVEYVWMTAEQAAVIAGVSLATIARSMRSAKIGRCRRIAQDELEQFLEGNVERKEPSHE